MSYRMRLQPKTRKAGRFALHVQNELQHALSRSGLRQHQLADMLEIDKSVINRRLTGRANLTIKSLSDMAWALDHDIEFALKPRTKVVRRNEDVRDHDHGREAGSIMMNSNAIGLTANSGRVLTSSATTTATTKNRYVVRQHEGA